jgi:hypothetical protein
MNTRNTTIAAFAAACLAGTVAYAGPVKPSKKIVEPAQESCITGDIGFDVVSNYITKGVVQNNQGFIIQPYADLHFRIFKGAGALTSVTVDVGIWNSFHSHHNTPAGVGTTSNWYEFDFQTGLTFNFNKLSLGGYYKIYESPSSSFANAYAVGISLAYDDSDLLGAFALHPYAFAELNLQGTTGNNFPAAAGKLGASPTFHGRGQYYEVGIAPAHSWGDLTLSLPVKAGFGSGGMYLGNRGFGFIGVGVAAAYALNQVPACLGKWTVTSGFTYYRLGGNNVGPTRAGSSGLGGGATVTDKNELVFQGGLKVAF